MHNPVLLPEDIAILAKLVRLRGLSEDAKTEDRSRIAGVIALFHDAITLGLSALLEEEVVRVKPNIPTSSK